MIAPVGDQQRLAVAQRVQQGFLRRHTRLLTDIERRVDQGDHRIGVDDGPQVDQPGAVTGASGATELERQPALADPGRAHERQQAGALEVPRQLGQLRLAPLERGARPREVARRRHRRPVGVQAGVLAQHGGVQCAGLGARIDPQLLHQCGAQAAVDLRGLDLVAGAVQREHELGGEALVQGVVLDQDAEAAQHLLLLSEPQAQLEQQLETGDPVGVQAGGCCKGEGQLAQVGQGLRLPLRDCLLDQLDGVARLLLRAGAPLPEHRVEAVDVDLLRVERQPVALSPADDDVGPER